MPDAIEILNQRDDVEKTEYTRVRQLDGRVTVEMWHDAEGLQKVAQKAMKSPVSPRAVQKFAKEQALIVRETRTDFQVNRIPFTALTIMEELKEENEKNEDYEYRRKD